MSGLTPVVFVVDDDPAVLRGVARMLRFAGFVTETFASAGEFLQKLPPDACGCVILDVAMPDIDGLEAQRALASRASALQVIFLTGHADIQTGVTAMKRGATDFLTKPVGKAQLLEAVRQALGRCEALIRERLEVSDIERRLATLTRREREVLTHVLAGKLNKQIAAELGTVENTVKVHRARIMEKMQAATVAALVRLAARAGITAAGAEPAADDKRR
jgi:FixJ family two-component response regulator